MLNVGGQATFFNNVFKLQFLVKLPKITEVSVKFYFKGWSVAD
jgi:hypothetical protein